MVQNNRCMSLKIWEIIDDVGEIIISSVDKVHLAIPKRGKRKRIEVIKEELSVQKGMEEEK